MFRGKPHVFVTKESSFGRSALAIGPYTAIAASSAARCAGSLGGMAQPAPARAETKLEYAATNSEAVAEIALGASVFIPNSSGNVASANFFA